MQKRLLSRKRAESSSVQPLAPILLSSKSNHNIIPNISSSSITTTNNKNDWSDNFIMDRCGLPCLPSFKGREGVQFISLQHNLIGRIDSSLASFRMLKVLNLYDNKIERISGLDNLISLKVLMLGKNRLKTTDGLESLHSLDILDLHGNQICALTGLQLRALRVLNVAANQLKKLTPLDGLSSLEELNAKRNRITKIATDLSTTSRRLERLYLSNNEIRRLDDLSGLLQLNGLKELSLDGNPVTLNANYVLNVVSSLPSLVLLDQNSISPSLKHEAECWSLRSKRPTSSLISGSHGQQCQPVKVAPLVTVLPRKTRRGSSASAAPKPHRNVAIVRPLSATGNRADGFPTQLQDQLPTSQQQTELQQLVEAQTFQGTTALNPQLLLAEPSFVLPAKSCMFRTDQQQYPARKSHKSFRQIAFSAMLCRARTSCPSGGHGTGINANSKERPVFKFSLRPPTAERNERKARSSRGRSSRMGLGRNNSDPDVEIESSSSWGSDESDGTDDDTASTLSTPSSVKLPVTNNNHSNNRTNRSSVTGAGIGTRVIAASTLVSSSRSSIKTFTQSQKLSATIGMNIKEQLRDLRIIVSDEEIHIGGINVIRMLHNMHWASDEVEPFRTVVFHGLSFDQLAPFYGPLRSLFPNLVHFVFRKGPTAPSPRHINALCNFESQLTHRWITQLNVESPACSTPTSIWQSYAIYRLCPFGLEVIDGREITSFQLMEAEDQYGVLDQLAVLTAPGSVAANRRQLERISSAADRHHGSASSSSSVSGLSMDGGSPTAAALQYQHNKEHENALLLKKRAVRNFFQIPKDTNRSQLRNRLPNLHYVAEYGMEVAVKLSILQRNFDQILADMVRRIGEQVIDETAYKQERLGSLKQIILPHKQQ